MEEPFNNEIGGSPFTKLAGVEVTRREDGYSCAVIKITDAVLGAPKGSVHGGAIATLIDVGMGAALRTRLDNDELIRTVQLHINYLAAPLLGDLICESRIIKKGRKIATLESEVLNEGNLVVKSTGTFYISKTKRS